MSEVTKFVIGEGIALPPASLATFLRDYALSKNIPIYSSSALRRSPLLNGMPGIFWTMGSRSGQEELQSGTPNKEITVQEFLTKCDNFETSQKAVKPTLSRLISLGDDRNVLLDGVGQVMVMRDERIRFEDIRRVLELSKDIPASPLPLNFSDNDGITGATALIEYLVGYAKEKGVKFGTDQEYAMLDTEGNFHAGTTRIRWHLSSEDRHLGLLNHTYQNEITVQEFLTKCDNYASIARYNIKLTNNYAAIVNHQDSVVQVGCQRIPFARVVTLVEEMDSVSSADANA